MGPAGVSVSDTFTMFSEQAISVLRMLVDRCQANENVQVDWGDIMFTLARYINRLSRDEISLRVKAKFCYLCEAVLAKPDCIVLSDGPVFRNAALQWIVEWATDMRVCLACSMLHWLTGLTRKRTAIVSTGMLVARSRGTSTMLLFELWFGLRTGWSFVRRVKKARIRRTSSSPACSTGTTSTSLGYWSEIILPRLNRFVPLP